MKEGCDSILVTLSLQTIKERRGGFRAIVNEWRKSDGNTAWWYKCGTAPKAPENIVWVYWTIGGRIRWRCRLLQVVNDLEIQFSTHSRPLYSKRWLVLFDFEPIPRAQQIEHKGFQGFRYYNE